jgi:hypothetical protein
MYDPSGEKTQELTRASCFMMALAALSALACQIRRVESKEPVTIQRPSGDQVQQETHWSCLPTRRTSLPVNISHNRTSPDMVPVTNVRPSGEHAQQALADREDRDTPWSVDEATLWTITPLCSQLITATLPSGAKAQDVTMSGRCSPFSMRPILSHSGEKLTKLRGSIAKSSLHLHSTPSWLSSIRQAPCSVPAIAI